MNPIAEKFVRETLETALEVDPASIRDLVERIRRRDGGPDEILADAIVETYARKGALIGFLTGLPGSPLLALPLAFVDTRGTLHLTADIAAAVEYLRRPDFFDQPDWRREVARLMGDLEGEPRPGEKPRGSSLRHAGRIMLERLTTGEGSRLLRETLLYWATRRTARRALLTKLIPVVGGFASAAWNYVELRQEGRDVVARVLAETARRAQPTVAPRTVPDKPATDKPAAEKTGAKKPATEKHVSEEPQREPPGAEKKAKTKSATRKPAAEKPARKPSATAKPAAAQGDLSKLSRKELYQRAQKAKVPGRSGMSKAQLVKALGEKK